MLHQVRELCTPGGFPGFTIKAGANNSPGLPTAFGGSGELVVEIPNWKIQIPNRSGAEILRSEVVAAPKTNYF